MSIFQSKTRTHKDNTKLVGVHILKEDAHRISLKAISQNISRSDIYRKLINDYLNELPSLDELIQILIDKVKKDWEETKHKNQNIAGWKTRGDIRRQWFTYRAELWTDLKAKKIGKEIIQTIVDAAEEYV